MIRLLLLLAILWPAPALAKAHPCNLCKSRCLCVELDSLAFRVFRDDEIMADQLRAIAEVDPTAEQLEPLLKGGERLFIAMVWPIPDMRPVRIDWSVGFLLKDGRKVEALSWLMTRGNTVVVPPFVCSPEVADTPTESKQQMVVGLLFPASAEGRSWDSGDIEDLLIDGGQP